MGIDLLLKIQFGKYFNFSPIELLWYGISATVLYIAAKLFSDYYILFVLIYFAGVICFSKWSYTKEEYDTEKLRKGN